MSATRSLGSRLETRIPADLRQSLAAGYRSTTLTDRLRDAAAKQEYTRRVDAFVALYADAERKPAFLYEWTRADRRVQHLYDEKMRQIIHTGIKDGLISRRAVIAFRAAQVRDDLAQFPDAKQADDTLFCALFAECGEMMEAQAQWKANPNPSTAREAVKETDDLIGVASLVVESQRVSA